MSLAVVICIETSDVSREKVNNIVDNENSEYSIEDQPLGEQIVELPETVRCNKCDDVLVDWNSVI